MDNSLVKLNEEYSMTYDYVIKNFDLDIDIKSSTNRLNTIKRELNLSNEESDGLTINPDTLNVVKEGMRSVAEEEGGTAYRVFKDFGVEIGVGFDVGNSRGSEIMDEMAQKYC